MSTEQLKFDGPTRTDLDCHECSKTFIAELDYSIDGNHIIECPHCGHEHCRVITGGKVTGDRWSSRTGGDKDKDGIRVRRTWKSNVIQATTNAASSFLRQRWLEKDH